MLSVTDRAKLLGLCHGVHFSNDAEILNTQEAKTVIRNAILTLLDTFTDKEIDLLLGHCKGLTIKLSTPNLELDDKLREYVFMLIWAVSLRPLPPHGYFGHGYLDDAFMGELIISLETKYNHFFSLFDNLAFIFSFREGEQIRPANFRSNRSVLDALIRLTVSTTVLRSTTKDNINNFFKINCIKQKREDACKLLGIKNASGLIIEEKKLNKAFAAEHPNDESGSGCFMRYGNMLIWQSLGGILDDYLERGIITVSGINNDFALWAEGQTKPMAFARDLAKHMTYTKVANDCANQLKALLLKGKAGRKPFNDLEDFKAQFPHILNTYLNIKLLEDPTPLW